MQTLLLLTALALAVLTAIIYRLVSAARRRADERGMEENSSQTSDQQLPLATSTETAKRVSSSPSPDQRESLPESVVTPIAPVPIAPAAVIPDQIHSAIEEDLPYADPVDGMPFEPGEPIVPCVCGLAYREDSVKWLADYYAGCCIHCGARVSSSSLPS